MGDIHDDLREVMGLLPCPFCGGEARLNDVTPYFWTVNCTGCETEGPPFPSSDESVSAWNTRPALLARLEGEGWLPIESAPQHKEVLAYVENAGVLFAKQTHLADVFATESELEALAEDGMTEDEMWRVCWWAYLPNGVVRMEDDCGDPTHWRPLPARPAARPGGGG